MTTIEHCDNPNYLRQERICALLLVFLQRLDERRLRLHDKPELATQRIMERIKPARFPELFDPQHRSEDEILWNDIKQLEADAVITIEPIKAKIPFDAAPWEFRRIVFNPAQEQRIRLWLNKPAIDPYQQQWNAALEKCHTAFKNPQLLQQALFAQLHKPALEIMQRLARIPELLAQQPQTAYQLSAQLFWGNSKLLRDREAWLEDLFELTHGSLLPRPLILELALPSLAPSGILLIENLDSYIAAADGLWPNCDEFLLVYTQGFKAATARIRNEQATRLHIYQQRREIQKGQSDLGMLQQFRETWFHGVDNHLPMFMLTDLDWAGMGIYKAIHDIFTDIRPWQPGYEQMLTAYHSGQCHPANDAHKALQRPVSDSGSAWLNEHVLPLLAMECYVDQEIIR